jgi:hypothetical protein
MKSVLIKILSEKFFRFLLMRKYKIDFYRKSLGRIHLQSIGTALANSLMFFIHAAAFGYGSVLVENGEMNPLYVFR